MGEKKIKPEEMQKLYDGDIKQVKDLIQRLSERLSKDPKAPRKAAMIIEDWLNQKPKKKK